MNRQATRQGKLDAQTFAAEHNFNEVHDAASDSALGADEALINVLGLEVTAEFFGLKRCHGTAFSLACADYNRAFAVEIRRIDKAKTAEATRHCRFGQLLDYDTAGEVVCRPAKRIERDESRETAHSDGGAGVILVDGVRCYVEES